MRLDTKQIIWRHVMPLVPFDHFLYYTHIHSFILNLTYLHSNTHKLKLIYSGTHTCYLLPQTHIHAVAFLKLQADSRILTLAKLHYYTHTLILTLCRKCGHVGAFHQVEIVYLPLYVWHWNCFTKQLLVSGWFIKIVLFISMALFANKCG